MQLARLWAGSHTAVMSGGIAVIGRHWRVSSPWIFTGQCPWAASGDGGQKLRARVAVRAVYTHLTTCGLEYS